MEIGSDGDITTLVLLYKHMSASAGFLFNELQEALFIGVGRAIRSWLVREVKVANLELSEPVFAVL